MRSIRVPLLRPRASRWCHPASRVPRDRQRCKAISDAQTQDQWDPPRVASIKVHPVELVWETRCIQLFRGIQKFAVRMQWSLQLSCYFVHVIRNLKTSTPRRPSARRRLQRRRHCLRQRALSLHPARRISHRQPRRKRWTAANRCPRRQISSGRPCRAEQVSAPRS